MNVLKFYGILVLCLACFALALGLRGDDRHGFRSYSNFWKTSDRRVHRQENHEFGREISRNMAKKLSKEKIRM